jgi:signal recognition particle subunit SRP54
VFDSLSEKLQATLAGLRGRGVLSEEDVTRSLREIRLALLEADVNFRVVKEFIDSVRERCIGAEVVGKLNPGQQIVAIVHEELAAMMGGESAGPGVVFAPRPPTVILMAGLQGSGKTTAAAKLARLLRTEHHSSVALAACDVHRDRKLGAGAGARGWKGRADRRHGGKASRRQ